MKNLIIIGARGYGRETYSLAVADGRYKVKGFLDDNAGALDGFGKYPPILGSVEEYEIDNDDVFICALGEVQYKMKYAQIIIDKGGEFISLIHPTAVIDPFTKIGRGCIIGAFSYVACGVEIQDFATIQHHVTFGHDVVVGCWCQINSKAFMGGWVKIENYSTVHTSAVVLPNLTIGENSVVGAGAVVTKNVPKSTTVVGIPANTLNR